MSISFNPATRDRVGLLIALAGGTGSGKSMSGLKLARGLAARPGENLSDPRVLAIVDARIKAIDTEAGRLKHYAPAPGELPGEFTFGFLHGDMKAPFTPQAYKDAIMGADTEGTEVILVDSGSHEWAGEGGVVDWHDNITMKLVEQARAEHEQRGRSYPFDEDKTWERMSLTAWGEPKSEHKKFVNRLTQCRAHIIFCLRAEEKLKIETQKDERGFKKTIITAPSDLPIEERWVPVTDKRLPFEFTLSLLLVSPKPGYPIPIKLEQQHITAVPLNKPLSEQTGIALAAWARGGASGVAKPQQPAKPEAPKGNPVNLPAGWDEWSLEERGANRASLGTTELQGWFTTLSLADKKRLKPTLDGTWKAEAAQADASRTTPPAGSAPAGAAAPAGAIPAWGIAKIENLLLDIGLGTGFIASLCVEFGVTEFRMIGDLKADVADKIIARLEEMKARKQ